MSDLLFPKIDTFSIINIVFGCIMKLSKEICLIIYKTGELLQKRYEQTFLTL